MEKKCRQKQPKIQNCCCSEEIKSNEWEFMKMTEQEEDIIFRMHKLVGDKWSLIAGRVPGRTAEEIERYWVMRNSDSYKWRCVEKKKKIKKRRLNS